MDSKIIIRDAQREDCETIYSMIREMISNWKPGKAAPGSAEAMAELLFDQKAANVIIAFYDGAPAGYCFYNHNASSLNCKRSIALDNLFVRVDYRRKGVGTAIFNFMKQRAVDEGLMGLKWFSPTLNMADTAFYTAMGLKPSDTRLSYTWSHN